VTATELPFDEIVFVDFEFISKPGEHPDVVCLAAHELRSRRTLRLWRDELGRAPPYRVDDRTLFVCFTATAELACHLALGWPLPAKVLDLSPEFRCHVNGGIAPQGKGLLGALAYFGLDAISAKWKDDMRARILRGWPFTPEEREQILAYCASDIDALIPLLEKLLPTIHLPTALYRSEFVAVNAVMEHRGVPINMSVFSRLADARAWAAVRDAMVPAIDQKYSVYVKDRRGNWHFSIEKFEALCARLGIEWPRLETGKLNLQRKTFESMCKACPDLEDLRQLRHTRDKMRSIKLAVGADGRNRTVLWTYQSKTGRTQPKASEWIFSPAVWLRSLITPPAGRAVAYIDWSSMEFLIAAALSDGHCGSSNPMLDMYRSGDPYLSFAKRVGAAPLSATKLTHETLRDRYKVGLLAIQYGIRSEALAARLGVSTFEAQEMLNQHHEQFAQYWRWSDDWFAEAMRSGIVSTVLGWECHTGITELNDRSISNWPIQANGAEILRIACIIMQRHGIELLASIHDAVLIEAPIDRIERDVALAREIMRRASRVVLNPTAAGTIELRTDYKIVKHPDCYVDKRGVEMWARALELLAEYERTEVGDEQRQAS
jgi:DNA polymerase family A